MDKKLEFFKKDEIPWGDFKYAPFYKTLFDLKHRNKALWNGEHGGPLVKVNTGNDEHIYAFTREKDGDKVLVIINLSSKTQKGNINDINGSYTEVFTSSQKEWKDGETVELKAWEYLVFSNK
jgi:glycosidase